MRAGLRGSARSRSATRRPTWKWCTARRGRCRRIRSLPGGAKRSGRASCTTSTSAGATGGKCTPRWEANGAVIEYERTIWWRAVFAWRGTVLPYILGRVGLLTLISIFVYLLEFVVREAL